MLPRSVSELHSEVDELGVACIEGEVRVDLGPCHCSCVVPGNQIELAEHFTCSVCVCVCGERERCKTESGFYFPGGNRENNTFLVGGV